MFPEADNRPSLCYQPFRLPNITRPVFLKLGKPVPGIRLGFGRMERTAMPEAPVDEERDSLRGEDDIRADALNLPVNPESESDGMQRSAQQ